MKIASLKSAFFLALFLLAAVSAVSCVSVNLKPSVPTKSSDYKFQEPDKAFQSVSAGLADHAWQNKTTGNTLAVVSECSEDRDPSLMSLENETAQALSGYRFLNSQDYQFQDRAARRSRVEGNMDGVPVEMEIVVFKKNSCSYTLTYLGRAAGFKKDIATFEKFLMGFEVP